MRSTPNDATVIADRFIAKAQSLGMLFLLLGLAIECPQSTAQEQLRLSDQMEPEVDVSEYFGGDDQDSLADLLRQAGDPGTEPDPVDRRDAESNDSTPADRIRDLKTTDDLLGESTGADNEDDDEASATLNRRTARQRVIAGHLERLNKPIHEIRLVNLSAANNIRPENRAAQLSAESDSQWITSTQTAPRISDRYPIDVCHRPLYFQEIDLERCGNHVGCLQNLRSASHFLLGVAIAPYRMATRPPNKLIKAPGDCKTGGSYGTSLEPLVRDGKDGRGVLAETAALAGFTFLLL